MNKGVKIAIGVVAGLVLLFGGFIGGFISASSALPHLGTTLKNVAGTMGSDETTTSVELAKRVNEVEGLMDKKALTPSTIESATAGALDGILKANGDKWAEYFPPVESKAYSDEMSGSFSGIGVVLNEDNGTVVVGEVYADSPAHAARVLAGDRFVAINGKRQDTWTSQEVSKLVRGKKGTDVSITFFRPDSPGSKSGKEITKTITRDDIKVKNIMTETYDNVGYIMMGSFNANSTDEVRKAIQEFDKKNVKGYVLDLRYNPGGLLDQAIGVSSLFLDKGIVVKVENRDGVTQEGTTSTAKITDKPLVVLVNGHSASASEVLTGAMKDHDRAEIVGEKTFGKGSVQEIIELTFGGSVKFTTAHWLTPDGHMIDGKGIEPDISVANTMDKMKDGEQYDYKKDAQLMKSISEVIRLAK